MSKPHIKEFSFVDIVLDILFDFIPPLLALSFIVYTLIHYTNANFALFVTLVIVFFVSILGSLLSRFFNHWFGKE